MAKRLFTFIFALASLVCVLPMRGENPTIPQKEIPIKRVNDTSHPIRSLSEIQAYYNGMLSVVCTSVFADLGEIDLAVTNCTTGEFWEDSFDSSSVSQHLLPISSTSGWYEVVYTTENGDSYVGTFVIESNL